MSGATLSLTVPQYRLLREIVEQHQREAVREEWPGSDRLALTDLLAAVERVRWAS